LSDLPKEDQVDQEVDQEIAAKEANAASNVASLEQYLRETLEEMVEFDNELHRRLNLVQDRLLGVTTAQDAEVRADVMQVTAGKVTAEDAIPVEEFIANVRSRTGS
jgi:hypothetical protein